MGGGGGREYPWWRRAKENLNGGEGCSCTRSVFRDRRHVVVETPSGRRCRRTAISRFVLGGAPTKVNDTLCAQEGGGFGHDGSRTRLGCWPSVLLRNPVTPVFILRAPRTFLWQQAYIPPTSVAYFRFDHDYHGQLFICLSRRSRDILADFPSPPLALPFLLPPSPFPAPPIFGNASALDLVGNPCMYAAPVASPCPPRAVASCATTR